MEVKLFDILLTGGKWDFMTQKEAGLYIKSGLIGKEFNMTPYVAEKRDDNSSKCEFAVKSYNLSTIAFGGVNNYLKVCKPDFSIFGIYQTSRFEKTIVTPSSHIGIVPVIRFTMHLLMDSELNERIIREAQYDPGSDEYVIKYGRYIYEYASNKMTKELEIAYKNGNLKDTNAVFGEYNVYDEYLYNGQYYGKHKFKNHIWVVIKDLEWILDMKNKFIVCRNIIDTFGDSLSIEDKLISISRQVTQDKIEESKKEYKVVDKENIMSQIIKNKYGINSEDDIKRELKR